MRFKDNWIGKIILGVVFSIFMLVVSLAMLLVVLPLALVPLGIALIAPSAATVTGGIISLLLIFFSFFVVGWAVLYFYKKNVFVYKKR